MTQGASLLEASTAQADSAKASGDSNLPIVAGPFSVGNIGQVAVVEREMGDSKYLYAQFSGSGRPSRIPLAACAAVVDALREEAAEHDEGATPEG